MWPPLLRERTKVSGTVDRLGNLQLTGSGTASAYETGQSTASPRAGYSFQPPVSPYLTTPASGALSIASQKPPNQALGASGILPGPFAIEYQARVGGQGGVGGRPAPKCKRNVLSTHGKEWLTNKDVTASNQYHRRPSIHDETVEDNITETILRGTAGQAETLDSSKIAGQRCEGKTDTARIPGPRGSLEVLYSWSRE